MDQYQHCIELPGPYFDKSCTSYGMNILYDLCLYVSGKFTIIRINSSRSICDIISKLFC